jgi:hypothetical protein
LVGTLVVGAQHPGGLHGVGDGAQQRPLEAVLVRAAVRVATTLQNDWTVVS